MPVSLAERLKNCVFYEVWRVTEFLVGRGNGWRLAWQTVVTSTKRKRLRTGLVAFEGSLKFARLTSMGGRRWTNDKTAGLLEQGDAYSPVRWREPVRPNACQTAGSKRLILGKLNNV